VKNAITDFFLVCLKQGILAAMPLAYILPAICYLRLEQAPLWSKEKVPALLLAIFGTTVAVSGLIMLLIREKEETNCSHGKQMPYCLEQSIYPGFHPYNGSLGLAQNYGISSLNHSDVSSLAK